LKRQSGKPVLVADLDIEDGLAAFLLRSEARYTVVDLLANLTRLDESLWRAMVNPSPAGVDVLAAPSRPCDDTPTTDARQLLKFARGLYSWTLVDLGRSHSRMLANVGAELDELYLVTTPEIPALHHARHLLTYIERCGIPAERTRIVLNREAAHGGEISAKELGELLRVEVAVALPDDGRALQVALAEGKLADANSRLGRRVAQLGARLSGAAEPEREKRKLLFLF
jgi:pilus assembly protein CpaE